MVDNMTKYIDPMVDWSFKRIFDVAEFAGLDDDDKKKYVKDMNTERDTYNQIAYAREEGLQKGREDIARKMLAKGADAAAVAELTELESIPLGNCSRKSDTCGQEFLGADGRNFQW